VILDFILTNAQICKEVTEKQNPKHIYQRHFCVGHHTHIESKMSFLHSNLHTFNIKRTKFTTQI